MMIRVIALCAAAAFASVTGMSAQSQNFTLEQALSAPFASDLVASQRLGSFAWVENEQGKRNLWIATPDGSGKYASKQLTSYDQDDGQEMYQVAWTPDAEHLIYVRGGDSEFPGRPDPNPALAPDGVAQNIWLIAATGGEPRKLGEGYGPVVSPAGDQVAFLSHGQIWTADLSSDASQSKASAPHARRLSELVWAPDAHAIAFVSERTDHSFIGVYDLRDKSLIYLDPSTENDTEPVWSPDSRPDRLHPRAGLASTAAAPTAEPPARGPFASPMQPLARGHSVWKAAEGRGSAFREIHGDAAVCGRRTITLFFPGRLMAGRISTPFPHQAAKRSCSLPATSKSKTSVLLRIARTFSTHRTSRTSTAVTSGRLLASGGKPKPLTSGTGIEVAPVEGRTSRRHCSVPTNDTPLRPALLDAQGSLQDLAPELIPANYPGAKFVKPEQVLFPAADGLQASWTTLPAL